jgi:hypothetical protein
MPNEPRPAARGMPVSGALPSRLLLRLDAAIGAAASPIEAACLRAERAGVLARHGQFDRARSELTDLRRRFDEHPQAAVSAWIALAEALLAHYSAFDLSTVHDRMRRAHVLAGAARLASLRTQAAAWLAHLHYEQFDAQRVVLLLVEALRDAAADDHAARSRACLVAALSYHFAGSLPRAQPWYARARSHATALGDDAMVSALMHNRAAMLGWQAREAALLGDDAAASGAQALLGAESTGHFDAGIGGVGLDWWVPVLRAHLLTLLHRHAEALALFDAHVDAAFDELPRQRASILSDRAWCHWHLGHVDAARADAQAAQEALSEATDADDRATSQARLSMVLAALGEADAAARLHAAAQADWQLHRAQQARLLALLDEALAGVNG